MPLISRLFRSDATLEACLVRDAAHVVPGAIGEHVAKIQSALDFLDHAQIARDEVRAQQYGRSTADAVLAYKRKRRIINVAYQTQADNIVGKMTIAALDQEMVQLEHRSRRHPACGDPTRGGSAAPRSFVLAATPNPSPSPSPSTRDAAPVGGPSPKFPANLRLLWHVTAEASKRGANRHLAYIPAAIGLLEASGMDGVVRVPSDVLPSRDIVDTRFKTDTFRVRKMSESLSGGEPGVLRVIVCPFEATSDAFGVTDGGTFEGQTFKFFILINVNKLRADNCTLLHEMIHAATGLGEEDHDQDKDSVFSVGSNRFVLPPGHAESLSKSFFASPK